MKIAVISDIHGNVPALEAVIRHLEHWQPDKVVVNGDVINRGPRSLDCLRMVLHRQRRDGWVLIRGNHEEYVLACDEPDCPPNGPEFELTRFAFWTHRQLNGELRELRQWPEMFRWFAPDGTEFRVTHASMGSNRDGVYPKTSDGELREKIAPPPAVFVTSHTHVPLMRQIDDTIVVNVGAVGSPFDQDRRPSYGQFSWSAAHGWRSRIVRVPYNYERIEQDYVESGFLGEAGPFAQLMLVELRKARGLVYRWARQYEAAVLAGEISMEESVRDLLQEEDVRPFAGPPGWTV